jgi:hypothetical protein
MVRLFSQGKSWNEYFSTQIEDLPCPQSEFALTIDATTER